MSQNVMKATQTLYSAAKGHCTLGVCTPSNAMMQSRFQTTRWATKRNLDRQVLGRGNMSMLGFLTATLAIVFFTKVPDVLSLSDSCNPNPCRNAGKCTSSSATYTCSCLTGFSSTNCTTGYTYGNNVVDRPYTDTVQNAILLVDPSQVIPTKGVLRQWTVYLKKSGTVYLQIWRPVVSSGDFKLVGSSIVSWSGSAGVVTVNTTIAVENFDLMGIYFSGQNPVPYSTTTCYSGNKQLYDYYEYSAPTTGTRKSFSALSSSYSPCRKYSIQAYVEPQAKIDAEPVHSLCSSSSSKYKLEAHTTLGWIRSPAYPDSYESYHTCYWTVTTSIPNHMIVLDVEDSYLEYDSGCDYDYVRVDKEYTYRTIKQWCGSTVPGKIYTYSSSVRIKFKTDGTTQRRGFSLSYASIDQSSVPVNNAGLIVGMVFLGLALLGIIMVIIACICCCQKKKISTGNVINSQQTHSNTYPTQQTAGAVAYSNNQSGVQMSTVYSASHTQPHFGQVYGMGAPPPYSTSYPTGQTMNQYPAGNQPYQQQQKMEYPSGLPPLNNTGQPPPPSMDPLRPQDPAYPPPPPANY